MFGGKGKIDIQIPKFNFSPGEVIEGKVSLKLNKPVKAKGVSIELIGIRKSSSLNLSKGRNSSATDVIFNFKQPLDGEKEYPPSESSYKFQIKIPANILTPPAFGEGIAGTLIKSAQILSGTNVQVNWHLIARLEIPWKIDVSKKLQINIA